ncbi:hypothetical protein EJ05DRAFT_485571 [Pseudovirgaria hyperparasitica]|uniref:Uncharacterized protein n=1 Tax=Pseudovirgaria hyperparasitica TaxID=470096 RepID=A0A6A6W735_9PEZI|nr:uncharacterized protein EJ05DRAFT_485571 [Pseudovirgaria hyperparasitica]KAF2758443.1 hypothetical protein EJ05DRAFT_485571 [Pseudovirgaria hyperparasitica]
MPSLQKDGTPWMKRILLPLWAVRMVITGILIVVTIIALSVSARELSQNDDGYIGDDINGNGVYVNWKVALGVSVAFFLIMLIVFLLDILSVIKFLRHSLTPKWLVVVNSIQTTIWMVQVGLEIWDTTRGAGAGGLVGSIIVLAFFVLMLIYAIITKRKQKKGAFRGAYQPAHNPAAPQGWQSQGFMHGQQGQQPYQTGAYEPYGGAGGHELGQQNPVPVYGAAGEYYAGTAYKSPAVEHEASAAPEYSQPVQPRQGV